MSNQLWPSEKSRAGGKSPFQPERLQIWQTSEFLAVLLVVVLVVCALGVLCQFLTTSLLEPIQAITDSLQTAKGLHQK